MAHSPYRLARVLAHPVWLAALALLIINDHLLKTLAPGLLTGKLSDVAGLVMAPALLATLLRLHTRRALFLAHAAIGMVFAAINLSASAAHGFEALMALGPFPWHITVDPSDLLALPALLLSWRLCTVTTAPAPLSRPFTFAAAALGLVSSLATSPPIDTFTPSITADLVIGADTNASLILRIRPLRDTVAIDCAAALRNPTSSLSRGLFGPAVAWQVDANRVVQVHGDGFQIPDGECFAALVDGTLRTTNDSEGQPIPMALVFWTRDTFPPISIESDTANAPPERLIQVGLNNGRPAWRSHSALFPAPPELEAAPFAGCEAAPSDGLIGWQWPLPLGSHTLTAVSSSPDGCHRLVFEDELSVSQWYVCTGTPLPFVAGDQLRIRDETIGQYVNQVEGVEIFGEGDAANKRVVLARGADLARWNGSDRVTWQRASECRGTHDDCGSLVFPLELDVTLPTGKITLTAGDFATLPSGTLFIQRAASMPIRDTSCTASLGRDDAIFESVYVEPRVIQE